MTDVHGPENGPLVPYAQVGRRNGDGEPSCDFCPCCGDEECVFADEGHEEEPNPPVTCDGCGREWGTLSAWQAEISDTMHDVETARGLRP